MVARSETHRAALNERVEKAQERYGYLSEEFKSDATREGSQQEQQGNDKEKQKGPDHSLGDGPIPPGGFPRAGNANQTRDEQQQSRDDEPER